MQRYQLRKITEIIKLAQKHFRNYCISFLSALFSCQLRILETVAKIVVQAQSEYPPLPEPT